MFTSGEKMRSHKERNLIGRLQAEIRSQFGIEFSAEDLWGKINDIFQELPLKIRPNSKVSVIQEILQIGVKSIYQNADAFYIIFLDKLSVFYSISELKMLITDFIEWHRINKDSLIQNGYPLENYTRSRWFDFHLNRNYYTKILNEMPWKPFYLKLPPFDLIVYQNIEPNIDYSTCFRKSINELIWVKDIQKQKQLYLKTHIESQIDYCQIPVNHTEAGIIADLNDSEETFLAETIRPKMYILKNQILNNCLIALSNMETDNFVNQSFQDIQTIIGKNDLIELIRIENKVAKEFARQDRKVSSSIVNNLFFDFGLTNILKLIYHIFEEISIGKYHVIKKMKDAFLGKYETDHSFSKNIDSYWKLLFMKKSQLLQVNKIVKKYNELDTCEDPIAEEWRNKIQLFREDQIIPKFALVSTQSYMRTDSTNDSCICGGKKFFVSKKELIQYLEISPSQIDNHRESLYKAGLCTGKPRKWQYALCENCFAGIYHKNQFFLRCKLRVR